MPNPPPGASLEASPREASRLPTPTNHREPPMTTEPTNPTWREKLILAAVRGAIAGAVRAIITWILER
ncbi:hypothetical protein GCM10007977_024910 [Dactylosporangium sucinum]|uniref:Uncharacterized protein n=1 Tax=Dactylosporangium sucinum TaxID=1424081 RepID=A0A917TGS3_9ACTN|nr:hypothetical protein GCM10007977_024910 [Dactylosporangium sucinum]